ncbi:putative signaling protein [Paraglaciecola mesophila]|uniref:cyclic-guanylate-specific phosphodiesterase n=1 Tax=Paraglaciecola mesophila TaxID=197222 RepID=A0A857JPD2_9ALTE|nr:bifunctional diguanylate cyclase/phosphodiesterase [Paraglaciecola mesophila]QHJ13232.1 putative signaling protein [Paraglaciecola mesophila]
MIVHEEAIKDAVYQLFDEVDALSVQGYDEERNVIYWNLGSELLYGYTEEEALGKKLEDLIFPDFMREPVIEAHSDWIHKGIKIPAEELTLRHKNGGDVSVFSSHVLFTNEHNKHEMYCIDINLAEVRQAQAQAQFKDNMLEAVFEATPDVFLLIDENGTIIDYHAGDNEELYALPKDCIGQSINDFFSEPVARKFTVHNAIAFTQGGISTFEYEVELASEVRYFEARLSHLSAYKQVVVIIRDITEQHKAAQSIRQHAYFDSLTSLPNRFLSLDRLSQMLKEAQRSKEKVALLFLDLDDFKKVNDSLGHEVGDKLLKEVANKLTLALRKADTVGRLGGDEFIVLLRSLTGDSDAIDIAENLLEIFREPFEIDGKELVLTLSIGIVTYTENGDSASDLLRHADAAMYQSKLSGRNTYSFFTQEMSDVMLRRLEIEEQLNHALQRDEFEVYYQPKFDVKSKKMIGAEALLRWRNPLLGNVTPDEFIPIAEHTGMIVPIGKYVLKQSLAFLNDWNTTHQQQYTIAVNLSPRQFRDKALISFIAQTLRDEKIAPHSLEFEITEGVLMAGNSYIDDALENLHQLGVKLSMDDFGTGYSSLSYLRQYSFDILKIDRSFISGITEKKEDLDLVKATIALAHSLDLSVVAEGVETHEQLLLLDELGCDLVQGYYFSKPIPAEDALDFRYPAN